MTVLNVRTGTTQPAPEPRRLRLSVAAMRWLGEQLPGDPPPAVSALLAGGRMEAAGSAVDELRSLDVLHKSGDEPVVVDAVRRTWAVLVAPRELVQVDVRGGSGGRSAVLATSGDYGVGVVQASASDVEVSVWLRPGLRDELARLVPDAETMRGRPSIASALGGGAPMQTVAEPVDVTEGAGLPSPLGRVDVEVFVRTADGPAAGRVHWVCANDRWWRLAPRGSRVLAEPVVAHDLGADVFRLLTAAATSVPADLSAAEPDPGSPAEDASTPAPDGRRRFDVG